MRNSRWVKLLAYRILRAKLVTQFRLTNPERATLSEIGKRLGRKALSEIATVAKPDTILAWYRKLVAQKFDGSMERAFECLETLNGTMDPKAAISPLVGDSL